MTVSILVVDDESDVAELFRQWFRREVRQGTCAMHFANSGEEDWTSWWTERWMRPKLHAYSSSDFTHMLAAPAYLITRDFRTSTCDQFRPRATVTPRYTRYKAARAMTTRGY